MRRVAIRDAAPEGLLLKDEDGDGGAYCYAHIQAQSGEHD